MYWQDSGSRILSWSTFSSVAPLKARPERVSSLIGTRRRYIRDQCGFTTSTCGNSSSVILIITVACTGGGRLNSPMTLTALVHMSKDTRVSYIGGPMFLWIILESLSVYWGGVLGIGGGVGYGGVLGMCGWRQLGMWGVDIIYNVIIFQWIGYLDVFLNMNTLKKIKK